LNIRNKKDFGAGIMYMAFGLFFALNALNYKMGTAAKMGPGYFPFWLGAILTALGFYILIKSMSSKNTEESIGKWDWRSGFLDQLPCTAFYCQPLGFYYRSSSWSSYRQAQVMSSAGRGLP
jgi:hypothetical protein